MRNFSNGPRWIPGTICLPVGDVSYDVVLDDGRCFRRHLDHIRERFNSMPIDLPVRSNSDLSTTPSISPDRPDSSSIVHPTRHPIVHSIRQPIVHSIHHPIILPSTLHLKTYLILNHPQLYIGTLVEYVNRLPSTLHQILRREGVIM